MSEVVYAGNPAVNRPLQNAINRWLVFMSAKPLLTVDGIFGEETWRRLRQVVAGFSTGELWALLFGSESAFFQTPESFSSREDLVDAATTILNANADLTGLPPAPYTTWPYPSGGPQATAQQVGDAKAKMEALGVSTDLGGSSTAMWLVAGLLAAGAVGVVAWKVWGGRGHRRRR